MMRYEPTLIVERLVVQRSGKSVYDEVFHQGVNVIRGENSSGKSTVLNFIFYGLGGDLSDWSVAALQCNRVSVQVQMNGKSLTLSREISETPGQPMEVFGGTYDNAIKASIEDWVRYPYRRSDNKESFSQALFRLLGIPEVNNESTGNITIHQVLRLLYADQLSPVEDLFRFERFDPPALRDTIGRLLVGAYDNKIYENELEIRSLTKEFDTTSGELRSLFSVVGRTGESLTEDWIAAERTVLDQRRETLRAEIETADRELYSTQSKDEITLRAQQEAYSKFQQTQIDLGAAQQELDSLSLSIADSAAFISNLEKKLIHLSDSSTVAENIGLVHYHSCPACLAALDDKKDDAAKSCPLCKTPLESEQIQKRIAAMINDTAIQLKQSSALQERRKRKVIEAKDKVEALGKQWQILSQELAALQRMPSNPLRERLRSLHSDSGYLQRQAEDLEQKAKLVALVKELSDKKSKLNERIVSLRNESDALRASQLERLSQAYTVIAEEIKNLLRNDLRREQAFENPKSVEFSFSGNKISVDGINYFSASSRVILKSSFFLGLFAAATKLEYFRHPRFLMIDTIEDKGMEPQRSHNFQMEIARVSSESNVEHQIIYATAMIAPDLDDEAYTIGSFSTRDDYTIDVAVQ